MRKYITHFNGEEVDLDNPNTYKYLSGYSTMELSEKMFAEIGRTLAYMDYLPSRKNGFPKEKQPEDLRRMGDMFADAKNPDQVVDANNAGWHQRQRVEALIKTFGEGRSENINNKTWWQEQLFLLQDETENMC